MTFNITVIRITNMICGNE